MRQPAGPLSSYAYKDTPTEDSQHSPGDTVHPTHEISAFIVCTHQCHERFKYKAVEKRHEIKLEQGP